MSARQLKVGNYQIGERLGEGTFGTVVKATHAIAGERVAVKVLEKKRMLRVETFLFLGNENENENARCRGSLRPRARASPSSIF